MLKYLSLINLMVSVDIKHHVYLLTYYVKAKGVKTLHICVS